MQRHFDKDIEELKDLLLRMGAMVEDSIMQSIRSLLERDTPLAEQVIANDDRIDQMELEIDRRTLELIAKMQPTAVDLRFVATVMKVTPELERIADLAQDAQGMVRAALDALVRRDVSLARSVITQDDSIDQQTEQSFRELLTYMLEDPRNISRAIRLTFIGKYFERMADGATNICEMVVYLVEGKMIKHAYGTAHNR
jgi:phosphate transport system protein